MMSSFHFNLRQAFAAATAAAAGAGFINCRETHQPEMAALNAFAIIISCFAAGARRDLS
jgi:hypothetical protein